MLGGTASPGSSTRLFLLQGDCDDGAPGLPGQPGTPGERVSAGVRGSECSGHSSCPDPQPSTLYSILMPKLKSLNLFQGLQGPPGNVGPKVSAILEGVWYEGWHIVTLIGLGEVGEPGDKDSLQVRGCGFRGGRAGV